MIKNYLVLTAIVSILSLKANAQKVLQNNLIGKSEFEFSASFLGSKYYELSPIEFIFRKPIGKSIKFGGGGRLVLGGLNESKTRWQSAIFLDIAKFIGERQKWSINLQPGYEFYKYQSLNYPGFSTTNGNYTYFNKENGGAYFSIGGNHRAIVGKKLQIITGIYNSYQFLNQLQFTTYQSNPSQVIKSNYRKANIGLGLKVGIVF